MKAWIAGASGLIGQALVSALEADGWEVVRLVRRTATDAGELAWNPAIGEVPRAALGSVDAVINLCGSNIAAGRWTAARRREIRRSRMDPTMLLAAAIGRSPPRPRVLINASAVGYYGDRGDEGLSEESAAGEGFLADLCREWEAGALPAAASGARVVNLRFGVVLSSQGGALARLLPIFRAGAGGRIGSGEQWMSWLALADAVDAIRFCLGNAGLSGPINLVAPEAVTNADFAAALGRLLGRRAVVATPAAVAVLAFGAMAREVLLSSTRAEPRRLLAAGFKFRHPGLEDALLQAVAE